MEGGLQDRKITALHAEPQIHKAHLGQMYVMSSTHKLSLEDMYLLVVHTALFKSSPLMNQVTWCQNCTTQCQLNIRERSPAPSSFYKPLFLCSFTDFFKVVIICSFMLQDSSHSSSLEPILKLSMSLSCSTLQPFYFRLSSFYTSSSCSFFSLFIH